MLVKVAIDCLKANSKSQLQEEIFLKLAQTRADFAIVLVQRLIQANSTVEDMKTLLTTVWTTIESLRGSFERVVPEADALYYRSLLKLLFLAVRIHAEAKPQPSKENFGASLLMAESATIVPTIINILKYVVSMGLRELVTAVHDSPADSSPEDIALLTGIMQSCLRIPGIELYHPQIVSMMITNSTARVATTLFSWSDTLAIDGDPIYGELSILFLLELSSIPLMAEQLAVDGLIGHISSANITTYLRRGNVSPFADGAGLQRCYSIWARGILPLLLNLLDAVQGSLATEVAVFLNQFQSLLTQCEQALDAPETNRIMPQGQPKYITLITCSEVHSVALLIFILNGFREALMGSVDVPEVKWDAAGVLENVEFWLGSRALLRERLLPMGDREVDMVRKKVTAGNAVSKLEEKVMAELVGIRDVLSGGDNA
jgi:nuclear pore complex protein Nup188